MAEHKLFYYPYARFTNAQLPLLKVAALYFDKLVILDPLCAEAESIGVGLPARDAVSKLASANILETVEPEAPTIHRYQRASAGPPVALHGTAQPRFGRGRARPR